MTLPRRLLEGATHFTTRRCHARSLFLVPTPETTAVVAYAFGLAASRREALRVHACFAMSNHVHGSLTDALGESLLSDFFRDFHSLVARALNAHLGRGDHFWSVGSYGNVEVRTVHDLEEQLLYLWTQPVAAGLVEHPDQWPGFKLLPRDLGREITVDRPQTALFGRPPQDHLPTHPRARRQRQRERREQRDAELAQRRQADRERGRTTRRALQLERDRARREAKIEAKRQSRRDRRASRSTLPDRVTYRVAVPPGYEHLSLAEVRAHFESRLNERVAEILAARAEAGLGPVAGVAAVLAQDPFKQAGSSIPTFGLDPRLSCKFPALRQELLDDLLDWRRRYQDARKAWANGKRDVVFPAGAYELPRFHGAPVEPSPRIRLIA